MSDETNWEDYVRAEVSALLDLYLPEAETGNVGIKYDYLVKERDEGGNPTLFDKTVIEGVTINLVFPFAQPMAVVPEEETTT